MSTRLRLLAPIVALTLALAACGGGSSPTPGTSATPAASVSAASPSAAASATPTTAPTAGTSATPGAVCTDAAAFRASVTALTGLQLAEVGVSGVTAALTDVQSSAQALLVSGKDLVAQPLANLQTAVQGLQTTLAGLGGQAGLGAKVVAVKAAIDQIKTAAIDVEAALGTACPAQ
jgi:hypothetical protein